MNCSFCNEQIVGRHHLAKTCLPCATYSNERTGAMAAISAVAKAESLMMIHLAFAVDNQSMQDSIYHLLCYHYHKDIAQAEYFSMTHEQRKDLHTLMIL